MTMEKEIGAINPHTKECHGLLAIPGTKRK
jgi:hypothetical protein